MVWMKLDRLDVRERMQWHSIYCQRECKLRLSVAYGSGGERDVKIIMPMMSFVVEAC